MTERAKVSHVAQIVLKNLIKKPWAFIRAPYMNPTILGVIGPGFLHQVPTLGEGRPVWEASCF